ncbi:MAG: hypothetical protein GXO65_06235 [Euryarchaeota archaeon]|nr:hypothetical protein [Euryarchaeota archaeon]
MRAVQSIIGFYKEEHGQGGIEYILIVGGIIVAAVVVLGIYNQMVKSTGSTINKSAQNASDTIDNSIQNNINI